MLDDELRDFKDQGNASGQVLGALISFTVTLLRHPRWLVAGVVVLFLIGASQHVHDMLLLPLGLALVVGGGILRLKGR